MNNWMNAPRYLVSLHSDEQLVYAEAGKHVPDVLSNWLARLRLLYGVPFHYLVPDSRLLPVESARFFYIDRNFTDRLVDGALSVGKSTTREFSHAQQTHPALRLRVDDEELQLRTQLRQKIPNAPKGIFKAARAADLTGLLLRTRAVSGWPGLEVKAYRGTGGSATQPEQLQLLRMDRLAPDVLLCIFHGVPTRVDVEEPREGIQFGVDLYRAGTDGLPRPDQQVPSGFTVKLRKLRGALAGRNVGASVAVPEPAVRSIPVPVRKSHRRVIHVRELRDRLTDALRTSGDADADPQAELTSGELALQVFQPPFRQRFEGNGGRPGYNAFVQYADVTLQVAKMAKPLQVGEIQHLFGG